MINHYSINPVPKPRMKKCIMCGEYYIPNSNFQKRCDKCKTFICRYCGKKFKSRAVKRKFCSQSCVAKSRKGKKGAHWEGGKIKKLCATCGKVIYTRRYRVKIMQKYFYCSAICANKSVYKRKILRDKMVGKLPSHLVGGRGKVFGNIKKGTYDINGKKIFLRSGWEANYALYLDFLIKRKMIKSWEYEKDIFIFEKIKFGTRSYRPDFKIANNDGSFEYHEVKGWMTKRSKTQLKRMKIYYPNIKLILIDRKPYGEIKAKLGKLLKFY